MTLERAPRFSALLGALAVAAASLGAAGARPVPVGAVEERSSGTDAVVEGARILDAVETTAAGIRFEPVSSSVSWKRADATDWVALYVPEAEGTLTVELAWKNTRCHCSVMLLDASGELLASMENNGRPVSLTVPAAREGRYGVRFRAEGAAAASHYDATLVWNRNAASRARLIAEARRHFERAKALWPKNRAAARRILLRVCEAAPDSKACTDARKLAGTDPLSKLPGAEPAPPGVVTLWRKSPKAARARVRKICASPREPFDCSEAKSVLDLLEPPKRKPKAEPGETRSARERAKEEYVKGLRLFATSHDPEAIIAFQTAIAIDPTFPDAHRALGSVAVRLGVIPAMCREFEEYLRLKPEGADARKIRGEMEKYPEPECRFR